MEPPGGNSEPPSGQKSPPYWSGPPAGQGTLGTALRRPCVGARRHAAFIYLIIVYHLFDKFRLVTQRGPKKDHAIFQFEFGCVRARFSSLQLAPARFSTLQHASARSSTLQDASARSSALQHTSARPSAHQHASARFSALQRASARFSTLQHVSARFSTLQRASARPSALQHRRGVPEKGKRTKIGGVPLAGLRGSEG